MSKELKGDWTTGVNNYFHLYNSVGLIWRVDTLVFEAYVTANIAHYNINATEQGTASGFYTADMPASLPVDIYDVVMKQRIGGSVAESDPTVGTGSIPWDGAKVTGTASNIKKNQALAHYEFLITSATTNQPLAGLGTAFTPTRSIDGGAFAAGTITNKAEVGNGIYAVDFLAADLNGNIVVLHVTAAGANDTFERIVTQP